MRTIAVACAIATLTTVATAQAPRQKTGYEIGGCQWYVLVDNKVHQYCDGRSIIKLPDGSRPAFELAIFNGGGDSGGNGGGKGAK